MIYAINLIMIPLEYGFLSASPQDLSWALGCTRRVGPSPGQMEGNLDGLMCIFSTSNSYVCIRTRLGFYLRGRPQRGKN